MNLIQEIEYYNQLERDYEREMLEYSDAVYDAQRSCNHNCDECIANEYCTFDR